MPGSSPGSAPGVFRATSCLNRQSVTFNPLNSKLNPICDLLALLGAHPILHVSSIRVNLYPRSLNRQNSDAIFCQAGLKQDMFLLTFLSFTVEEALREVVK